MPSNVVTVSSLSHQHHHPHNHHQQPIIKNNDVCDTEQQNHLESEQQQQQQNNSIISNSSSSPSSPQSSYNSSYGSNSGKNLINQQQQQHNSTTSSLNNSSITSLVPGGVVTTQNISTVIKPKSNNNSLQFVKIQTPELSKKAVEQLKLAEETKISKSKIKEVEEEWQNNLLNWKSKRRQQFSHTIEHEPNNLFETNDSGGRKIKTFAEMIEQRAKSGNRLGFHLQRYISADDEEGPQFYTKNQDTDNNINNNNNEVISADKIEDSNYHKESFLCEKEQQHQMKNHSIDHSEYEVRSSTSSSYNQLDSKSPTSPEIEDFKNKQLNNDDNHQHQQNYRDSPFNSGKTIGFSTTSRCDNNSIPTNNNINNGSKVSHDETDHSMSLVDLADETEQLNSTFKKSLVLNKSTQRSTSIKDNTNLKLTPSLDVDIRNNEVSALRSEEDESDDNSAFEEEEEEEEEQKHLQRIAFEAKLKAFERLTEPSSVTKQKQSNSNRKASKAINTAPIIQNKPVMLENTNTSFEERQKLTPPVRIFKEKLNSLEDRSVQSINHNNRYVQNDRLETTLSNLVAQEPPPPPRRIEVCREPILQQHKQPQQTFQQKEQSQINQQHQSQQLCQQYHHSQQPPLPEMKKRPIQDETAYNIHPTEPYLQTQRMDRTPSQMIMKNNNNNQSNLIAHQPDIVQRPKSVSIQQQQQLPLPPEPAKNPQPNQRKPAKEDKDRTVLSVSGKKRCSSCKEELGRGAAAFVVESLSLVYHTNCFRCSVCHVNLSNGFRGVDVRVHAGALHCQNCYSRDGLNFSRV